MKEHEGRVGKPVDRVDGRLKVTGAAQYAAEFSFPRLAHAVSVQSTIAKGKIEALDSAAAEKVPGVLAVLTYRNAPKIRKPPPGARGQGEQSPGNYLMLQDDRVTFWGQHVAVVVAETFEAARHAASLVRIRYKPETARTDFEAELSKAKPPDGGKVHDQPADTARGDPEKALADAEIKVEPTYTTPLENHNPMEPHATIAVWDGPKLTVYDATQYVSGVRKTLATSLDLKEENVRVVSHFIGGAFGCKGATWPHVTLAAIAAKHVGRPVKLVLSRQQMFTSVGYRPRTSQRVRLAATRAGKLTALVHAGKTQTGPFAEFVEPVALLSRMLYDSATAATSHRVVTLDANAATYMRSPGEASGSVALEAAVDELAYALKMDPLELRLRNYADKDPGEDKPWSSKSLKECYRVAAERFGWAKRDSEPRSMRDGHALLGWGMASASYPVNRFPASARVTLHADGSALVESGSHDLGTGAYTVLTQVASETLGLPVEHVVTRLGDTDLPGAGPSGGSSTTASVGSAVFAAAEAVRSRLIDLAVGDKRSPLHGLPTEQVAVAAGRLYAKADKDKTESFAALMERSGRKKLTETRAGGTAQKQKKFSMHAFGAVFAAVRVDPLLGEVRVRRLVAAYAAGRILNAKTARSQYLGGLTFGLGMALLERTVTEPKTGRIVTRDLADYLIPVNADVPEIEAIIVPEEDPHVNPIGVKGIGEIGIVGAAAAIVNAIYHATGKRVRDLPITLDKLL